MFSAEGLMEIGRLQNNCFYINNGWTLGGFVMSDVKKPLITVEDIKDRLVAIEREADEVYEREYRYSYSPDRMQMARLYQESRLLKKVLEVIEGYSLEEIQRALDERDPMQKVDFRADGLGKYSFDTLGHAEKVLQHQDKELQARVDRGERVIGNWENTFKNLSWEEDRAVYGIIRDKDVPYERLEEKIRKCLIRMNLVLQEDLCDIGGRRCLKLDEWKDGEDVFRLGNAVNEGAFYYADVNGKISNCFEYDFRPSREQVEEDWMNQEAMRAIDEHEAEFGADGRRAFPGEDSDMKGNSEFFKFFYAGEEDAEAYAFQRETGWHMIFGSDYEGLNGDTWVVFRAVEDLPSWLREYAAQAHDVSAVQIGSGDVEYDAPETPVVDDLIAEAAQRSCEGARDQGPGSREGVIEF